MDITVTGASPLIINNASAPVTFGTITLQDGGYIQITVPVTFSCQRLIKIASGTGAANDILIVGQDQPDQHAQPQGAMGNPNPGKKGASAKCGAGGGVPGTSARGGGQGGTGGTGIKGDAGADGGDSPPVVLQLGQVTGSVSVGVTGGKGGAGGNGSKGGPGGQGGQGGSGTTCGACKMKGGKGGTGGTGGSGSDGGHGGSGGNTNLVQISFTKADSTSNVLGQCHGGRPGAGGASGGVGTGGQPGQAGSHGGTVGQPGQPGTQAGAPGGSGSPGSNSNSLMINGLLIPMPS